MSRRKVWGIEREVLEMVNQAARQTHPLEFAAALRAEEGVIYELVLLPGSISSEGSATFPTHNMPIDFSVVGSVHSHPGPSNRPSEADLHLFSSYGSTHIITCMPYDMSSWRCYDRSGRPVELQVV
jgi:proteasome lid subunit RPN8/RPN11